MNCRYDLSGNSFGDRCPECGWDVGDSLRTHDFYTRDYAIRTVLSAAMSVLTSVLPVLGLFFAYSAWRFHRGAAECCASEKVRASQTWFAWSRAALLLAIMAGCGNVVVTVQVLLWLARWLLRHT